MDLRYVGELTRDRFERIHSRNFFREEPLKVCEVERGVVLPRIANTGVPRYDRPGFALRGRGGVVDAEGSYVEISAQSARNAHNLLYGAYDFDGAEVVDSDECVIYLNNFFAQWGHFLLDVVGRLWYAVEHPEYRIVYTSDANALGGVISGSYLEFFELLGIDVARLVRVDRITRFRKVIIPEAAVRPGDYYTREYEDMFDRIVKNAGEALKPAGKVYCSRARLIRQRRWDFYEDTIEEVFRRNGYRSVHMETMTLREQVQLLNSAERIAMPSGSLPHNLLFLRGRARVVILNKCYRPNIYQMLIDQLSGADVIYVDAYVSPMPVMMGRGPFIFKRTPEFVAYCKDNGLEIAPPRCNSRLTLREKLEFWNRWLRNYRRLLLHGVPLIEDPSGELEFSLWEIRKIYRHGQRKARRYRQHRAMK